MTKYIYGLFLVVGIMEIIFMSFVLLSIFYHQHVQFSVLRTKGDEC